MLEIRDLRFSAADPAFPGSAEKNILNGVSLTVESGRFVVLTGPNGGGKTTLAKCIMGLMTPSSGSIFFDGEDITRLSVTERAARGISYGFQQPPRFKGLKVRDLLCIASGNDKLSTADCCRFLNRVGLCAGDYVDREADASLSGGEIKRIEIATILARSSKVMIFDEPEAGIDLWSFARLTETFRELHKNSDATIIIISHQERIIGLADEIVVLSDGVITSRGSREEVFPQILSGSVAGCRYGCDVRDGEAQ